MSSRVVIYQKFSTVELNATEKQIWTRTTATDEIELVEIMIETICFKKKANSNQDASVAPINLMAELLSLQVARVLFKIRRSILLKKKDLDS